MIRSIFDVEEPVSGLKTAARTELTTNKPHKKAELDRRVAAVLHFSYGK